MSTLSGVTQKGEKGKSRFQSLDINNLYNQTSRGESSEPHQQKSTKPRNHGMQPLGKVPSARRPPANLPSLKSEHSGNDPSVSLVPSGGTGWGSKPGETGPSPASQPTSQATTPTPVSTVTQTHGSSAPAAAGIGMPAAPTNIAPPQTPVAQPPPMMKPIIGNTSSGDKTWSSVTCGDSGPSFLAHQSPQFQQEFPSLSGEGAGQAPPGGVAGGGGGKGPGGGADIQYGPGPSLRPQTEGSWIGGGGARAGGSSGPPVISPPSHPPQHPYLPQEIVGGSQSGGAPRSNLGPFGAGGVPVGLPPPGGPPPPSSSAPPVPTQFRNVMPNFLQKASGFSGFPPPTSTSSSNFQNNIRPPRFNPPDMNRFNPSRHADPEDLVPRPIIKEEDLTRMDEIARDNGWAANNYIDYNQKIAFSDDESTGVDDDKEAIKEKNKDSDRKEQNRMEMDTERDSKDKDKPIDRMGPNDKQIWAGRGPGAGPVDFRQYSRPPHSMVSEHEDDHWSEKRRQTSENIKQVTEKAKQRKEEEEKKFEESRSKTSIDNDKSKGKKDDGSDMLHHNTSPMSEWNKDDMSKGGMMSHPPPPSKDSMNESGGNNFRQMTQIEGRNDIMRDRERFRNDRMEGGRNFHQAPRFQKQQMGQQQVRQAPSNAYDGGGGRWSNQNSHGGGPMNFPVKGSVSGRRGGGQPDAGDIQDNDRFLHKDDKMGRSHNDERDRYRPNARNDGAHESNRKNNYYDGPPDYNRSHHRDFDHNNRERNKDSDYRQRDRDELEWEGRRGNNASWDKQYDDKSQGRKDHKKPNEPFHKSQTPFGDDRDLDRPQRPESRDRPDRPPRPDSRDSRASRDSRNSRDSIREDSKSIPESSDFSWGLGDFDKESKDDKSRKKDVSKDEKRDGPRREGHVPGPITKEKMVAYEIKQQLSKTEKKEIISSTLINSVPEEDTRNKLAPFAPQLPASASDTWSENQDILGPTPGSLIKDDSPTMTPLVPASEDITDKSPKEDQTFDKKKDGGSIKEKDGKNSRGGRGPRTGNRQGDRPYNPNSSNFFFQRNASGPTPYPRDNNRRRGQGKGGMKDKREFGSDSDGSLDEISASTESGKEDKKSERRQLPRSSRSGERKKDKDERNNRETKKIDNDKGLSSRKHGYDSVRKEGGFAPRGEPSRRGRGGYRTGGRGSLGNVGGHYGPPGSKSPFPSSSGQLLDNKSQEEDDKLNEKPLDMDHLLSSDADKSKHKSQHQGNITGGNRLPKDSRKSDVVIKGKVMRSKGGSGEERDSTSDAGSDSDTKKPPRNMQKTDKNKSNQRAAGDKRAPYNTAHMNGRPSRSDDGKDNGFQEVKGKKMGKESRPLSRGRKDSKGKNGAGAPGVGGGLLPKNNNSSSKSFQRESWTNNKPPRLQKLDNARKQQQLAQQQDVSEMNKINQSVVPLFSSTIRDVTCNMTPAPPPTKSAWEKPITAALRAPSPTNTLHLTSSISSNPSEKPGMEIPDHVQSGTSSQTSSPSAEKVMGAKLGREVVDKGMLDGANPPVQTIIFENTNYKTPELAMKSKYSMKPNQRIDKGKLDEELEGATHGIGSLSFKTGVDLKSCDNKTQESLQMQITFKNEDNADMKLDFQFDSDFTTPQLTDDKTNIPRSIHLGQSSAELNQKIASVKKVWDTAGSAMEHQHHVDESHIVSTSSSSFLGGGVDSSLDHPSAHQVDDNTFTNADVYSPGMQGAGAGYAVSAAAMMKPDPTNPASGVKPQPQQAAVMSTAIGAHSGQSLSSPPPPFNQAGPFGYQAQYSGMPTIPSPPAVLVNTQGAQVAANTQDFVPGHPYAFNSPMISSQTQRSSFSQQHTFSPYRLSQNLSQQTTFGQPPANVYIQPQQTGSAPPELFPSVGPYLPPSYGQSQINSNPSTVLIASSSSSSLMSASVKSSPQQPHGTPALGAIGTKASFQNSQIQMGFMSYDHSMIPSYMPASQLVTPRHGGGNVTTAMPPSSSFYSGSTAPTGFSSLLGSNSQTMHSAAANAFGMQTFNTQSAANQGAAPPSSNLGHPSFSTMGHFRATQPPYMKPGGPGQHQPDASKSPSNNQDCLSNSVFGSASGGGGQIPSPKSRSSGGSSSSGKQVSPQQPSPTPTHHKFPTYSQQNMVGQPPPNSQAGPQRAGSQLGSAVRSNNGNNGGTVNNSVHVKYPPGPPGPIQRPGPNSYQQHQQQVMQSYAAQQQQQQHPQQQQQVRRHGQPPPLGRLPQHKANTYYMPQGNPVKMESGMEVKGDQDKFMDNGSVPAKQDKKEEVSNSAEQ
uniref:Protein PRRC2A n=1 Tax=Lygus hesperus TaxID=30085 RepID=A0A0A9ZFT9_LYGHE